MEINYLPADFEHQIEGNNFDRRKTVLQYDEVNRRQREVIYAQRKDILFNDDVKDIAVGMVERSIDKMVNNNINPDSKPQVVNNEDLYKLLKDMLKLRLKMDKAQINYN